MEGKIPHQFAEDGHWRHMELIAPAIESDDELVAHYRSMSDAEGPRCHLRREAGGYRSTRWENVQLSAATYAARNIVDQGHRDSSAPPSEVLTESGGRENGPVGQVELGKPSALQLVPPVVVYISTT